MFVFTNDAYGDSGRKAAQAAGMLGCLIGVCVLVPSGIHVGYAGLVELETGNVVWFNTDLAMRAGWDSAGYTNPEKKERRSDYEDDWIRKKPKLFHPVGDKPRMWRLPVAQPQCD